MEHLETKELRQGNIILVSGKPGIVSEIYDYDVIRVSEPEYPVSVVHTRGIPISEEWLNKFGIFRCKSYPECFEIPNGFPSYEFENGRFVVSESYYLSCMPEIKHVHQFQNLYFTMTGKELEIKEHA